MAAFSSLAVAASAWLSNSVVPPLRLRRVSPPIIAAFPVGSSSPSASSSPLGTSSRVEAKVDVRDAGPKGLGAFATEPVSKGTWVCAYQGTLVDAEQAAQLETSEYLFALASSEEPNCELSIDASNSSHFSRYFNHAQRPTLTPSVDTAARRIEFWAACDIAPGDELTFDCTPSRRPSNHRTS